MDKEKFEEYIEYIYIDDELILKFLKVFSRAEYALKNKEDYNNFKDYKKKKDIDAKAYWDNFGSINNDIFLEKIKKDKGLQTAKTYLCSEPPKKQKFTEDGKLEFVDDETKKDTELEQLLSIVRTVRNNLFHGGKHRPIEKDDDQKDRNEKLIRYSIQIIRVCMDLDKDVKNYYNGL